MTEQQRTGWLDERFGASSLIGSFLYRKVPRGVGWWQTMGSATLVVLILLLVNGAFLMFNYST